MKIATEHENKAQKLRAYRKNVRSMVPKCSDVRWSNGLRGFKWCDRGAIQQSASREDADVVGGSGPAILGVW